MSNPEYPNSESRRREGLWPSLGFRNSDIRLGSEYPNSESLFPNVLFFQVSLAVGTICTVFMPSASVPFIPGRQIKKPANRNPGTDGNPPMQPPPRGKRQKNEVPPVAEGGDAKREDGKSPGVARGDAGKIVKEVMGLWGGASGEGELVGGEGKGTGTKGRGEKMEMRERREEGGEGIGFDPAFEGLLDCLDEFVELEDEEGQQKRAGGEEGGMGRSGKGGVDEKGKREGGGRKWDEDKGEFEYFF